MWLWEIGEEEKQYRQTISAANGETVTNAFTNPPNRRSNMPQFQCEFQILQWQTHEYKDNYRQIHNYKSFSYLQNCHNERECKIVLHNFAFQLSLHLLQRDICSNPGPSIDINLWLLLTCNLNIQTQLFLHCQYHAKPDIECQNQTLPILPTCHVRNISVVVRLW